MPDLKKRLRRTIQRFGYDVHRIGGMRLGRDHMADIKLLCGGSVQTILDVGANVGQAARGFLEEFPQALIYSFEPFPEAYAALQRNVATEPRVRPINLALGDKPGKALLGVQHGSDLNSFLSPAPAAQEYIDARAITPAGQCEVEVSTLDRFCDTERVARADLLKIDTQGFELNVLKGATAMLAKQVFRTITLEVNFVPLYEAQPSFNDLLQFLQPFRYRLVGLYELAHAPEGYLKWADAVFVAGV
jgi:FkbM family methyltransferase